VTLKPSSPAFDALADELERRFGQGVEARWSDADFDELAARVFRHQFEQNLAYQSFCERHGVTPDAWGGWEAVPAVPTMAFQHVDLVSVDREAEAVFRTSGTTGGAARRGRHFVPRLSLYRASLIEPFRTYLTGGPLDGVGVGRMRFVSLIPSVDQLPDSSLSFMVSAAADELASETDWLVDAEGALDLEALRAVADESARVGDPILLLGTALSFVHALERLGGRQLTSLPEGSRIMETGGFKGLGRIVSRTELYDGIAHATGVPTSRIVNEYGMTELLSQLYEPVLSEGPDAVGTHVPPPWLRVRALDPVSLDPVQEGEDGILAFFDLANVGSVSHILTEDVGSVRKEGVRLRGRLAGAEPRGCSRAMDELMSAAGVTR
jgi:hypothetical protein